MSYNLRRLPPAAQEKVDALGRRYRNYMDRRVLLEQEVREELRRKLDQHESAIAVEVFQVLSDPDVTNRSVMVAIGKQNPARWKEYLEKWSHLYDEKMIADDRTIEAELTAEEFLAMQAQDFKMGARDGARMFKMRTLRFPHDTIRKDNPGNDVIVYWPDEPLKDEHWGRMWNNPCWAVHDSAPVGKDREVIVKAIQEWLGEAP